MFLDCFDKVIKMVIRKSQKEGRQCWTYSRADSLEKVKKNCSAGVNVSNISHKNINYFILFLYQF